MYALGVQTSIASGLSFSSTASFRLPCSQAPAVKFNNLSFTARRQCITRASSSDVSTQTAQTPISFQVGETSLTLPFSLQAAKGLSGEIDNLLTTFKEREKATRPQRWKTMEFRQGGDDGGVSFEFFCNPNAYANAFQAKVLITVNDDKIKVTTEGQLSALKSDIDQYIDRN